MSNMLPWPRLLSMGPLTSCVTRDSVSGRGEAQEVGGAWFTTASRQAMY